MISKVKLKNWKCHLDSEIEFVQGTNTILGVMGAGKSSILEAISFGLFGTFTNLQQKKVKLEDVIMSRPVRKDYAEVEITLQHEGKIIQIKRRIERKKGSSAELRIDGKLVEVQPQRVTEFIQNILKIDFDLFSRAIYSEQNKIETFLTISKSERKKKIDEVLNIERFEKARATTVSLINRFKKYIEEKEIIVFRLKGEADKTVLEELERDIKKLEEEMEKARTEREKLEKLLEERIKEQKEMENVKREIEVLRRRIEKLEGEIKILEKDVQIDIDLEKVKEELKILEEEYEKLKNIVEEKKREEENILKELRGVEGRIKEVENKKKRMEHLKNLLQGFVEVVKEKEKVEEEIKKKEEEMEEMKKRYYGIKNKIPELEKSLEELKKAGSNCPVCEAPLTEEKKILLIDKRTKEIEEMKKEMFSLSKNLSVVEKEREELSRKLDEIKSMLTKKQLYEKEISEIEEFLEKNKDVEEERKELEKRFEEKRKEKENLEEKLRDVYSQLGKKQMEFRKAKEIEEKKKEKERKESEKKELEKSLAELEKKYDEEKYQKITEEIKTLYAEKKNFDVRLDADKKLLDEKKIRYEELVKKIKLIEEYKREIEKLKVLLEDLEKLKNALKNTQEELRKNFISAINQAMQSLWQEMYPYGDFQSIRLFVDKDDYILQLQDLEGKWISVDKVSGGERTLAALTLRISFALVLAPQMSLLILDEPTHNLDIKAREELAKILRERVTEFIEQVILITHDTILEDAVSGYLYRIERDKEKNGVSKIVRID